MQKNKGLLYGLGLCAIGLAGTGCGGSSGSIPSDTAHFVGRMASGVTYNCGGKTGVTDEYGAFKFVDGEGCTFSVGALAFSASANALHDGAVTARELASSMDEGFKLAYILHAVSNYETDYTMQVNPILAARLPEIKTTESLATIRQKLIDAGIHPRSDELVMRDVERLVNSDGSLVFSREQLLTMVNNSYTRKYPTITAAYNMSEFDYKMLLGRDYQNPLMSIKASKSATVTTTTPSCKEFQPDTVKSIKIGAIVNQSKSCFDLISAFDYNTIPRSMQTSASTGDGTLSVSAWSEESTSSFSESVDTSAAGQHMGIKAAVSIGQAHQNAKTSFTANTYAVLKYLSSGGTIIIPTSVNEQFASLSGHLRGINLDDKELNEYYHIKDGVVTYDNDKLLTAHADNVLGSGFYKQNIQIIGAMIKDYNDRFYGKTISNLTDNEKIIIKDLGSSINTAIQTFYAYAGESFVSEITLMNLGSATGALTYTKGSTQSQNAFSLGVSGSYTGAANAVSGSLQTSFDFTHGYSDATKNFRISSHTEPLNSYDIATMEAKLKDLLTNSTTTSSAPLSNNITLPTIKNVVEAPTPLNVPPKSCYDSYYSFKGFQTDRQNAAAAAAAGNPNAQKLAAKALSANTTTASIDYKKLRNELKQLYQTKAKSSSSSLIKSAATDNVNAMIDPVTYGSYFVSGFQTTPYATVIAQLMPNLELYLDVIGASNNDDKSIMNSLLKGFPNAQALFASVNRDGSLVTYINFISNFYVSNISSSTNTNIQKEFNNYRTAVMSVVTDTLKLGKDVSSTLTTTGSLSSFTAYLREEKSIDNVYISYLEAISDAGRAPVWQNATSGYAAMIPSDYFANNSAGYLDLFVPKEINSVGNILRYTGSDPDVGSYIRMDYGTDLLTRYRSLADKNKAVSPWFPIYQYNGDYAPHLVFVQTVGAYQIIYDSNGIIAPNFPVKFDDVNQGTADLTGISDLTTKQTNVFNEQVLSFANFQVNYVPPDRTQLDESEKSKYSSQIVTIKHLPESANKFRTNIGYVRYAAGTIATLNQAWADSLYRTDYNLLALMLATSTSNFNAAHSSCVNMRLLRKDNNKALQISKLNYRQASSSTTDTCVISDFYTINNDQYGNNYNTSFSVILMPINRSSSKYTANFINYQTALSPETLTASTNYETSYIKALSQITVDSLKPTSK